MKRLITYLFIGLCLFSVTAFSKEQCESVGTNEKKQAEPIVISQKEPKISELSLENSVKLALTKKPSVHAFKYAIKNYEQQRKGTLSTFLPNVTLNETMYNEGNDSNIKSSFNAEASQTVINLAQVNQYNRLDATVSKAKHDKQSHEDDIRLATETAFLNAWLLQQQMNLILLLYNASTESYERSKNQFELDLLDKNDWLKAKSDHAKNLVTVNNYQDDVSEAEKALEYYTQTNIKILCEKRLPKCGMIPPTDGAQRERPKSVTQLIWDHSEPNSLELPTMIRPFKFYFKKALKNRKDLKSKDDTITLQRETSQYYTKQYLPTVSLFGSATKSVIRNSNSTLSKSAGLRISWNVFDGLSNYFNREAANAEKMKAILEKSDLHSQIRLEVQQAHSAYQKAHDSLSEKRITFNQASNEFELRKQQLEAGLIAPTDFQTAKYTYEKARIDWLTQTVTTGLKERELLKACGYPAHISQYSAA